MNCSPQSPRTPKPQILSANIAREILTICVLVDGFDAVWDAVIIFDDAVEEVAAGVAAGGAADGLGAALEAAEGVLFGSFDFGRRRCRRA